MKIVELAYPFDQSADPTVSVPKALAIGYFDGVHLGHKRVITQAVKSAQEQAIVSAVMTFHPHPREIVGHYDQTSYLTPLHNKLQHLEDLGVEVTYVVTFDRDFSELNPQQFIEEILIPLQVKTVVVGYNFTFGHKGEGTPEVLHRLGQGHFQTEVITPIREGADHVSSTVIRSYLNEGNVIRAAELLGRRYRIQGKVVVGEGRGRTIGIPTANLELLLPFILPRTGVYAVRARHNNREYNGVMNIGYKPTFHDSGMALSLEVHLFDFNRNIYDESLEVEFIEFLRPEQKFASVDSLIVQIHEDMEKARKACAATHV